METANAEQVRQAVASIVSTLNTDIMLYTGEIHQGGREALLTEVFRSCNRPNILFVLTSSGGNVEEAYGIANYMLENFETFECTFRATARALLLSFSWARTN